MKQRRQGRGGGWYVHTLVEDPATLKLVRRDFTQQEVIQALDLEGETAGPAGPASDLDDLLKEGEEEEEGDDGDDGGDDDGGSQNIVKPPLHMAFNIDAYGVKRLLGQAAARLNIKPKEEDRRKIEVVLVPVNDPKEGRVRRKSSMKHLQGKGRGAQRRTSVTPAPAPAGPRRWSLMQPEEQQEVLRRQQQQ